MKVIKFQFSLVFFFQRVKTSARYRTAKSGMSQNSRGIFLDVMMNESGGRGGEGRIACQIMPLSLASISYAPSTSLLT